jgi:hypothetical protein
MLLNLNLGSNQVKVQIVTVLVARILEHRRINRISKSEKANQVSIRPGIDRAFTFCTWKRSIVTSQRTRNPKISFTHFFHPHISIPVAPGAVHTVCAYVAFHLWRLCEAPITIVPNRNDTRLQSPSFDHQSSSIILLLLLLQAPQPSEAILGAIFGTWKTRRCCQITKRIRWLQRRHYRQREPRKQERGRERKKCKFLKMCTLADVLLDAENPKS